MCIIVYRLRNAKRIAFDHIFYTLRNEHGTQPWRFGSCFSFSFGCFWSSMLMFPGVVLNHLLFWSNKLDSGLRLSLPDQNLSIHQTGSNKEWGSISFLESPEAIRVLSANTSLKDSKPIQTLVIFLGLLFAKVFTRTWWYLSSYYSTRYNYYTNNLHDLHWLLYGIQRSWQCSIVLQLAWTSHVQVLHTDAST